MIKEKYICARNMRMYSKIEICLRENGENMLASNILQSVCTFY
jgi:hypothetical protein